MKLLLEDIGRDNFCGIKVIPDGSNPHDIAEYAHYEATKHLLSRNVSTRYEADTNKGYVFAGFHAVGTFSILKS